MYNNPILDELRDYSDKLGLALEGLLDYDSDTETGQTPREIVFTDNKLTLYHYLSSKSLKNNTVPVLIVYALVNRPTILDLQEGHSAISKLVECGLDIYLVDWGYPDRADNEMNLDNYINGQLHQCVETLCENHHIDKVNLLAVCQGGTLSLCYSSIYPERVNRLVTMVTPVDFKTDNNLLSHWVQNIDIDLMVDALGNIPGSMISNAFLALNPYKLQLKKYLDLVESMDQCDDWREQLYNFVAMEQWIFDSPDQAGEAFRHFIKSCYQQNQLVKGKLKIGGKIVDLHHLNMPILNIFARQDHIVPPAASRALKHVIHNSDYEEMEVPGGHIGIFVNKKSINHIFPVICDWFQK